MTQRIIVVFIIAALGWYGYNKYQDRVNALRATKTEIQSTERRPATPPPAAPSSVPKSEISIGQVFKCDGRIYCSQMTSCAEATFFLKNCPGTKMDGDNDGIPCESQWCR